ncbi:unnamed protein product [Cunninghamella blakesleeana]
MPMQFSNNITINQSVKRRMFDDDDDDDFNQNTFHINEETIKKVNNLNQTFDPTNTSKNHPQHHEPKLPSLTYASPDYRPLPRKDALWLQPVPQTIPLNLNDNNNQNDHIMEDDLTDEDDSVPTPCYQPNNQIAPSTSATTTNSSTINKMNPSVDWMMSEQC